MATIPSDPVEGKRGGGRRRLCRYVGACPGQVKEVVIGGPTGAAKYFNADVFPLVETALGIKVIYEGANSLTNLQKMTADKAEPRVR
jgi:hypothetical protein